MPEEEIGVVNEKEEETEVIPEGAVEEELVHNVDEAEALKLKGNQAYGSGDYSAAIEFYSSALALVPKDSKHASVYHANSGACHLALGSSKQAVDQCTCALEIDGSYVKALMRRSTAYENLDELEKALDDAKKVLELDDSAAAKEIVQRLEPKVMERREKMKDEMIGKLKDMGNAVLGKFGMSLDNFKAEKDPATGSYSINFNQ